MLISSGNIFGSTINVSYFAVQWYTYALTHISTHMHTFPTHLVNIRNLGPSCNLLQALALFFLFFLFYKPALMASGDKSASSPVTPVRMEVNATKKLETVTVLLVTQEKPVPYVSH